jgi:hypothetical protein
VLADKLTRRAFLKLILVTGTTISLPVLTHCTRKCSMESLNIVLRSEWGAMEPDLNASIEGLYDPVTNPGGWLVYDESLPEVLNTIVVHHSALPLRDGPLEIQYKHMQQKGFADIGYNFVIDEVGQIYEGRSLTVRGAHTGGHNTGTIGIVLLGNFEETEPTAKQQIALKRLVRCLADEYDITHLAGHRDFQPEVTVCPGKNLEALLPDLATELQLEFGTGGYVGSQP